MRFLSYAVITVLTAILIWVPAGATDTTSPVPLPPQSPLLISAYSIASGARPMYLELYNNSSTPLKVADWTVTIEWGTKTSAATATDPLYVRLSDNPSLYIPPDGYVTVGFDGSVNGASVDIAGLQVREGNFVSRIGVTHAVYRANERTFAATTAQSPMRLNRGATGYTTTYTAEDRSAIWQTPWYTPAEDTALRIVELYPNQAACQPFDASVLCKEYVKLWNPTGSPVDLSQYRLRTGTLGQGATASTTSNLSGVMPQYSYAVVELSLSNSGSWAWLEDAYGIAQYRPTTVEFPDSGSRKGQAWSLDDATHTWRWTRYPTPYDMPNQFTDGKPVNECTNLRLSEIGANVKQQFIEVYNAGEDVLELEGCQIQTNRSQDVRHVFASQQLQPGEYISVDITRTPLILTKTTTGTVYLLSSDGNAEVDARSYENLSEDTSFALVDGVWRQTFTVTQGGANEFQEYPACQDGYERNVDTGKCNKIVITSNQTDCGEGKYRSEETGRCRTVTIETASTPCKEGQYRNEETGRCRAIPASTAPAPCKEGQYRSDETGRCRNLTVESALTPCREGQYRSAETNRCRNVTTAASGSTLTPCKEGQERNPATNRCRAVATTTSSTLKPCAAGQERNPDTNRCRKVVQGDGNAGFEVVENEASSDRQWSWLALGGMSSMALGYGAWEWRREVFGVIGKAFGSLPFVK